MWSPCTHSTKEKGPVPTGLRAGSPPSIALRFTISPLVARLVRNGPKGDLRWKTATCGSVSSTDAICEYSPAYALAVLGSRIRSNVYLTSDEVNFSPLWKAALSARLNFQVVGSTCVHDRARSGTNLPDASMSTSLLKMFS